MASLTRSICWIFLLSAFSAEAQVITRQRDSASRSESSDSVSEQRTLTPGALFFPLLSEIETRMNNNEDLEAVIREKAAQGILNMPPNPSWTFLGEGCHVLLQDRWVWGTNANAKTEWEGPNWKITEPTIANQTSNQVSFSKPAANTLGKPVQPDHYLWCVQYHAEAITKAIAKLQRGAIQRNGVIYVKNLKAKAAEALYTTLISGEMPQIPRLPVTPCAVPVFSSMPSQNTFRCSPWVVTQSPLQAIKGGQTVLSDDTVFGVKYAFQDSLTSNKSRSNSTTDSRKARIEQ